MTLHIQFKYKPTHLWTCLCKLLILFSVQDERTFSEDEEEKLEATLGLGAEELELLLQTLEFFLQQVHTLCGLLKAVF